MKPKPKTLIERIQAALADPAAHDLVALLDEAASQLLIHDSLARTVARVHGAAATPATFVEAVADILAAAAIARHDEVLIRYDRMDATAPPGRVQLEHCPNCRRVGRVRTGPRSTVYVHTAWRRRRGEQRRHYCELAHDGISMDVVIPMSSGPEGP